MYFCLWLSFLNAESWSSWNSSRSWKAWVIFRWVAYSSWARWLDVRGWNLSFMCCLCSWNIHSCWTIWFTFYFCSNNWVYCEFSAASISLLLTLFYNILWLLDTEMSVISLQIKDAYSLKFFEDDPSRLPSWCNDNDNVKLPFCHIEEDTGWNYLVTIPLSRTHTWMNAAHLFRQSTTDQITIDSVNEWATLSRFSLSYNLQTSHTDSLYIVLLMVNLFVYVTCIYDSVGS